MKQNNLVRFEKLSKNKAKEQKKDDSDHTSEVWQLR